MPCHQQGLKVLGTPFCHPEDVWQFLEKVTTKHDLLLSRIPMVDDLVPGSFCCIVRLHVPIFFCGL